MKVTIDRTMWHRGQGAGSSALRVQETGKMCCLGFLALECGYSAKEITTFTSPGTLAQSQDLAANKFPEKLVDPNMIVNKFDDKNRARSGNTPLCTELMVVNDDRHMTERGREDELSTIFAEAGIEVQFIN